MNIQITGYIHSIADEQTISDKFSKRSFIVEVAENPQFPQFLTIEFQKDKCKILDKYSAGEEVKVDVNLNGRLWTNKENQVIAFNTLVAWRIESTGGAGGSSSPQEPDFDDPNVGQADDDDLPF